MPMKKVRFTFEIDISTLLQMLAQVDGGRRMRIETLGDDPPKTIDPVEFRELSTLALKALPYPRKRMKPKVMRRVNKDGNVPSRVLILQRLQSGEPTKVVDLIAIALKNGNTKSAASVGLDWLKKRKWVKRVGSGTWQITALGKQQVEDK